jgi:ribonuclease D
LEVSEISEGMEFKPKISKEEINKMPLVAFGGKINVIDKDKDVAAAVDILRHCSTVGIDTETRPSFKKGVINKVALLQVASKNICYLFRLNTLSYEAEKEIFQILSDEKIMKIGLALRDDFARLHKLNSGRPANIIDLQSIAKQYGILELGLQKMFAIIFGKRIAKNQQHSNLDEVWLTAAQRRYAATDAWACLKIYNRLRNEKKITKPQIDKLLEEYPANPNQILKREREKAAPEEISPNATNNNLSITNQILNQ